jgi:hypothetical protein
VTTSDPIAKLPNDVCPEGGQHEPIGIAYGLPSSAMVEAADRGEIILGGCLMWRSSPTSRCRKCGTASTSEGWPRLDGLAGIVFPEESPPAS